MTGTHELRILLPVYDDGVEYSGDYVACNAVDGRRMRKELLLFMLEVTRRHSMTSQTPTLGM